MGFSFHNNTNSDYANYSSHILIFLRILKKISEHEFALSYTDHLPFFSSGMEHRLSISCDLRIIEMSMIFSEYVQWHSRFGNC